MVVINTTSPAPPHVPRKRKAFPPEVPLPEGLKQRHDYKAAAAASCCFLLMGAVRRHCRLCALSRARRGSFVMLSSQGPVEGLTMGGCGRVLRRCPLSLRPPGTVWCNGWVCRIRALVRALLQLFWLLRRRFVRGSRERLACVQDSPYPRLSRTLLPPA